MITPLGIYQQPCEIPPGFRLVQGFGEEGESMPSRQWQLGWKLQRHAALEARQDQAACKGPRMFPTLGLPKPCHMPHVQGRLAGLASTCPLSMLQTGILGHQSKYISSLLQRQGTISFARTGRNLLDFYKVCLPNTSLVRSRATNKHHE
jgi:hypothetical protein